MFKNVKKLIISFFLTTPVICKHEKGIADDSKNDESIKECYVNLISIARFIDFPTLYEIPVCSL